MAHIDAGKTTTTERILYYTGHHLQDGRGPRGHGRHGLDGAGAGARHHHHLRRHHLLLARPPHQHHRHPRPRGLHRRGGALAARAGRRGGGVRRGRAASSRSPRRSGARPTSTACRASASSTRWTASAPTSARRSSRSSGSCGANPVAIQLPIGAEEHFAGVIDLVEMQAIRYQDETLGAEYVVDEIPAEHARRGRRHYREMLIEKASRGRRRAAREVPGRRDDRRGRVRPRSAGAPSGRCATTSPFVPVLCGSAFKNKGVQPLLDAVVDYLPSPLDIPPVIGHRPAQGRRRTSSATAARRRAVLRPGLQDHDRPVRRPARLLPRLLRAS